MKSFVFALVAGVSLLASAGADCAIRSRVCLNGMWEMCFSGKSSRGGISPWTAIPVPSAWGGIQREAWDFPDAVMDATAGVYRLRFPVPDAWKTKKVRLFFERVDFAHSVSLNGVKIHEEDCIGVCETVDATSAVKWGTTNELTVATFGPSRYAGVCGDVFIEAVPQVSIDYVLIDTDVGNRKLSVRTHVSGVETAGSQLTLKGRVSDSGGAVLSLPDHHISDVGEGTVSVSWKNPILWGYGKYGSAHLYRLRMELWKDGQLIDVKHERFGFRSFGADGDRFTLNGKPIFIKGDLYSKTRVHTEHPAAITAFYQRMRSSGMNFLRGHSGRMDNSIWAEVADELGFMFQPEMVHPFKRNGRPMPVAGEDIRRIWRNYVIANYNHPSVISWCVNNEAFSVGLATPKNMEKIDVSLAKAYDSLISDIRSLDPARIVEINHNYCLWPLVKDGKFSRSNFRVFNIHPYGNLKKVIDGEIAATGFHGEVPVLVGEVYCSERKIDFMQMPREAYAEQFRVGESYVRQIADAASAKHVSGIVLCAQSGTGFIGYADANELHFGPWDDFAKVLDNGELKGILTFNVRPSWPSTSGRGAKVERYPGWMYGGGNFGLGINWFDPTVPMFRTNIVDRCIRESYEKIGDAVPLLPPVRVPEVIAVAGAEAAGQFVWLSDPNRVGEVEGTLSDPDGVAWFRLPYAGRYQLACGDASREFTIATPPPLTQRAGYDYITWVEVGSGKAEPLRKRLTVPVAKEMSNLLVRGEMLKNGGFEYADSKGRPIGWNIHATNCVVPCASGGKALRLRGGTCATQMVRLEQGKTYRISGVIEKIRGRGKGEVRFTSSKYKVMFAAFGDDKVGRVRFNRVLTATGKEVYFYAENRASSPDAEMLFDDLSVMLLDENDQDAISRFNPGPFELGADGALLDWIVLGPFPNRGDEVRGYEAVRKDFLKAHGGEANYEPRFGRVETAVFDSGFYWIPGEYQVRWRPIHLDAGRGSLEMVSLRSAAIATRPANNVAAYLACTISSPDEREVRLGMGSDDGYVVWLNGVKIGESLTNRGAEPDQEVYAVRLRRGANRLLVKALQEEGDWRLIARLTGKDGKPCTDVRVTLPDEGSMFGNGDFELAKDGVPIGWTTSGSSCDVNGVSSLRLVGREATATRKVKVTPGRRYRVEGRIRANSIGRCGVIGVRNHSYKWLVKLESSGRIDTWERVSGTFTAPIGTKSVYFYCMNWYQRPDDVLLYTGVRMFDIGEDPSPQVISDEPGRNPRFVDGDRAVAYLTVDGEKEVWKRIDLDTGVKTEWHKPLQNGTPQNGCTTLPKDVVAVSADKSKAAFQVRTGGTVNLRFIDLKTNKMLYETKAKSASMQINGCHSPEFLPDGRHVVFVSGGIQPLADIMLVDVYSGQVKRLTDDKADNQSPSVSSNGRFIVFSSLVDGEYRIRILSIAQYL